MSKDENAETTYSSGFVSCIISSHYQKVWSAKGPRDYVDEQVSSKGFRPIGQD